MRRPAVRAAWSGRVDAEDGEAGRRWHQVVRARDTAAARVALIGFACDAGVVRNQGRPGAASGPLALRQALANLPVHALDAIDDLGDVVCAGDSLETAQEEFSLVVADTLRSGSLPIGLGGGHEMALASWRGLHEALQADGDRGAIGILNFDAHFDLRAGEHGTSGTPFRQILEQAAKEGRELRYLCMGVSRFANTAALFNRAVALGVRWMLDEETRTDRYEVLAREVGALAREVDHLYLTICLDAFPAAMAPGVSAPAALGIDPGLVERLVDVACAEGKVRIADVAELNPSLDIDGRTARLGARIVARLAENVVQPAG